MTATVAEATEAYRISRSRGRKAERLADVMMRPEMGLRQVEPRAAETALRDLSVAAWHVAAELAGTRPPSRDTVILVGAIVRQRLENRR